MDEGTTRLLDGLQHPGAAFLLQLLSDGATEAELLAVVRQAPQATANRRLVRLEDLGLIEREAGRPKAPGRRWVVRHHRETEALLSAAVALADAVTERDQAERKQTKRKLLQARVEQLGISAASKRRS